MIGATFEDIAGVIERVEDKTRVGVCFDTCHAYAAVRLYVSLYSLSFLSVVRSPSRRHKADTSNFWVVGVRYKYACGVGVSSRFCACCVLR